MGLFGSGVNGTQIENFVLGFIAELAIAEHGCAKNDERDGNKKSRFHIFLTPRPSSHDGGDGEHDEKHKE